MTAIFPSTVVNQRNHPLTNDLSETETVMLDIDSGTYFGLKDVGKVIWDRLASPTRVDVLCDELMARFDVDGATCRREVAEFLDALRTQGLIEVHDGQAAL